jgi:hypothetical protein
MALQAPCPREAISVDLKGGGPVAMFHESDTQFGLLPFVYSGGLRGLPYGHGRPGPNAAKLGNGPRRCGSSADRSGVGFGRLLV